MQAAIYDMVIKKYKNNIKYTLRKVKVKNKVKNE